MTGSPTLRSLLFQRPMLVCLALLGLTLSGFGVTVDANTNVDETVIGRPVVYRIQIEGTPGAEVPINIDVPGLTIRYNGQQKQVQILNFNLTATTITTYTVIPQRPGTFTIPPQEVVVQGKRYQTPPVQLVVHPRGGSAGTPVQPPQASPGVPLQPFQTPSQQPQGIQSPPGGNQRVPPPQRVAPPQVIARPTPIPSTSRPGEDRPLFAELSLPKDDVYVGEIVPVILRFYFAAGVPMEPQGMPQFSGDDFTVERLGEPELGLEVINGRRYQVATFRTTIVPVKAGDLELPPATLRVLVQGSPDQLLDDFFNNFLGGSGFNFPGFSTTEEVDMETNAATLAVQPLPAQGRPEDFSGAVGSFTLASSASPDSVGPGDPVTLKATIEGKGNFNAMGPPALEEDEGWRSYPPKQDFVGTDELGYRGTKTFDFLLIAETDQSLTPAVRFSYFDPVEEKYVSLTAPPIPVSAQGSKGSAPPAGQTAAASASAPPAPVAPPAEAEASPVPIFSGKPPTMVSFLATTASPGFLWINLGGAAAFLGMLGLVAWRKATEGERGRRMELKRSAAKHLSSLARGGASADGFYNEAIRFLSDGARAADPSLPADPGLSAVLAARKLDSDLEESIRAIYARAEEVRYSANGERERPLAPAERDPVLSTLKRYQNAKPAP